MNVSATMRCALVGKGASQANNAQAARARRRIGFPPRREEHAARSGMLPVITHITARFDFSSVMRP
jgi:hypothetical protein